MTPSQATSPLPSTLGRAMKRTQRGAAVRGSISTSTSIGITRAAGWRIAVSRRARASAEKPSSRRLGLRRSSSAEVPSTVIARSLTKVRASVPSARRT